MVVKQITQPPKEVFLEHTWPPPQGAWTYEDYARLPDNGVRYEIIEGELYMSPAPRPSHQRVSFDIAFVLNTFVKKHKLGQIFTAPIDVNLPEVASPVQPDVVFISNDQMHTIKEAFIEGVPNLVIEILSPGNPAYDRRTKFHIYARAGVQEYWIIDPHNRTIDVFVLRGRAYALLGNFGPGDEARSELLDGFTVLVDEVCGQWSSFGSR
ncbi:MAG: Uma2 family endonuclease [Anaerolineales bacterium]